MRIEKYSKFVFAFGMWFEVPPETNWVLCNFRGEVLTTRQKDEPQNFPLTWDCAIECTCSMITIGGCRWQDMKKYVGDQRYTEKDYASHIVRMGIV